MLCSGSGSHCAEETATRLLLMVVLQSNRALSWPTFAVCQQSSIAHLFMPGRSARHPEPRMLQICAAFAAFSHHFAEDRRTYERVLRYPSGQVSFLFRLGQLALNYLHSAWQPTQTPILLLGIACSQPLNIVFQLNPLDAFSTTAFNIPAPRMCCRSVVYGILLLRTRSQTSALSQIPLEAMLRAGTQRSGITWAGTSCSPRAEL